MVLEYRDIDTRFDSETETTTEFEYKVVYHFNK